MIREVFNIDLPFSLRKTQLIFLFLMIFALTSCSKKTRVKPAYRSKPTTHSKAKLSSVAVNAKKQVGKKYKYGGNGPSHFDCSGLTTYVFKQSNIDLPRTSKEQAKAGRKIAINEIRSGDLVFFGDRGRVTHVGIVVELRGKYFVMVHSSSSKGVTRTDVNTSDYWRKRYIMARRIL